jgi:molybdenum cofactor cytidylyltransferase
MLWGIVILAAGKSARMGRPKMLLPWADSTVIGHQIEQWKKHPTSQIAVVCPPETHPLLDELDRLSFPIQDRITNAHPEQGMFSSIQAAARWPGWKDEISHWVISLGDQPHLANETRFRLIRAAIQEPDRIWQPALSGRATHPVVVPARVFRQLADSRADNLKTFLHSQVDAVKLCYCEDPGLGLDMDTPGDYETLRLLHEKTP